jgi:hypothetical protein
MSNLKDGALGAAGLALVFTVSSASAQDVTRIRGTIEKVDGNTLAVKSREGANLTIKLKDGAAITGVEKAMLSDIKQNSFIGITAMPQPDGTQKAIEVHIFPEARRGAGEGHRPWDLVPNSTMTNANVEQLVTAVDETDALRYKDGGDLGAQQRDGPQFISGDRGELKPSAKIFIASSTKKPDGTIETGGVNVGCDGIAPPMWAAAFSLPAFGRLGLRGGYILQAGRTSPRAGRSDRSDRVRASPQSERVDKTLAWAPPRSGENRAPSMCGYQLDMSMP